MTAITGISISRKNRAVFEWAKETARREGRSFSDFLADALRLYRMVRGEDADEDESQVQRFEDIFPPGEEITIRTVQKGLGLSYTAAKQRMYRLAKQGVVKRIGRGRYVVRPVEDRRGLKVTYP